MVSQFFLELYIVPSRSHFVVISVDVWHPFTAPHWNSLRLCRNSVQTLGLIYKPAAKILEHQIYIWVGVRILLVMLSWYLISSVSTFAQVTKSSTLTIAVCAVMSIYFSSWNKMSLFPALIIKGTKNWSAGPNASLTLDIFTLFFYQSICIPNFTHLFLCGNAVATVRIHFTECSISTTA